MSTFQLGVIEGFYGRDWSDLDRLELLPWLQKHKYQSYIYAPKSDHYLRSQWDQPLLDSGKHRLRGIQNTASALALTWGIGFSPLGAVHCFDAAAKRKMSDKLKELIEFDIDICAVLFDDMHCATDELAAIQCEIVDFIANMLPAQQIIMCPSFYSYDPILEKVFGAMPTTYWERLGEGLDNEIDVFWTGNKVCSESVYAADLIEISQVLRRPVTLWDNYPVNDGERASKFLNINCFSQRDWQLPNKLRGHFCNPMNQCLLSRIAMASLPLVYEYAEQYDRDATFKRLCLEEFGNALGARLIANKNDFARLGLDGLNANRRNALQLEYSQYSAPAAREICEWLDGRYAFDPACLTETGA